MPEARMRQTGEQATAVPLCIVSASRASAESFSRNTLLGRSLACMPHKEYGQKIAFANRVPLALSYNAAIADADPETILAFCHDDVWLGDEDLRHTLSQALHQFDVVGLAGNRRLAPGMMGWWLQPGCGRRDALNLVGVVYHGSPEHSEVSTFGASPSAACLLDGVFLVARAGVLQRYGLGFDPQFPFHFYDLDFCRSALAAGLRLGVWPLKLIHASRGTPGSDSWQACLALYQRKWEPERSGWLGQDPIQLALPPPSEQPLQTSRFVRPLPPPAPPTAAMTSTQPAFELTTSRQFIDWLAEQHLSLAFTTYQIGKLFSIGLKPGGELSIFERTFNRCMGLCPSGDGNGFYMSSLYQVWRFENLFRNGEQQNGHDRLYVPQLGITTGDCDIHDMAVDGDNQLVMVNTLFSCLAAPSETHSFRPLWRPPFISRLAAEDRCHLNGLAMRDGRPGWVTAVSASDAADGWREHRRDGGVVIDVASNEIVARGLSMPHSPRWYQGRLWICNSGTGEFGFIDLETGRFEPISFCAGYLRGVAFHGDYALLGTSKPRHNKTFSGLPLDEALAERNVEARCGIQVVDLRSGDAVHWLRLEGLVDELYDVITLPGVRNPSLIGFVSDEIRRLISIEE